MFIATSLFEPDIAFSGVFKNAYREPDRCFKEASGFTFHSLPQATSDNACDEAHLADLQFDAERTMISTESRENSAGISRFSAVTVVQDFRKTNLF